MTTGKSEENRVITPRNRRAGAETLPDSVCGKLEELRKQALHQDEMLHDIQQRVTALTDLLEKYEPLLERFADPGAKIRTALGFKGKKML